MKLDNYECEGQMSIFDLDLWSGKTCTEPLVQTKEMTLDASWKKLYTLKTKMPLYLNRRKTDGPTQDLSWVKDIALHGEDMTLSSGVYLKEESAYVYSLTLTGGAAPKILFELWREAIDTEPDKAIADTGCESRPEIQSLSQGMSGDTEPGGKEGEGTPEDTQDCIGETGKCLNSWDVQSKHIQPQNGIAESLYSGECRGGGGESYVLQTYGISAYDSNSMKSPNPHSGIYEADTTRTLDLNGGNPACNQGGMAVVYGLDRASFNQGKNAQFGFSVLEEQSPTITAKGPGGVLQHSK